MILDNWPVLRQVLAQAEASPSWLAGQHIPTRNDLGNNLHSEVINTNVRISYNSWISKQMNSAMVGIYDRFPNGFNKNNICQHKKYFSNFTMNWMLCSVSEYLFFRQKFLVNKSIYLSVLSMSNRIRLKRIWSPIPQADEKQHFCRLISLKKSFWPWVHRGWLLLSWHNNCWHFKRSSSIVRSFSWSFVFPRLGFSLTSEIEADSESLVFWMERTPRLMYKELNLAAT